MFQHPLPMSMPSHHNRRATLAFTAISSVCMINTTMVLKGEGFEIEIPPALPAGSLTIHLSTRRRAVA
jgi:2-methylaconitate cis-trans-isomerase PrpF